MKTTLIVATLLIILTGCGNHNRGKVIHGHFTQSELIANCVEDYNGTVEDAVDYCEAFYEDTIVELIIEGA